MPKIARAVHFQTPDSLYNRIMAYVFYNPNPKQLNTGDCVIRALTLALDTDWHSAYIRLAIFGDRMCQMPSTNTVWGAFLMQNGYKRYSLPTECPDCYSVKDFADEHPKGKYVLATGTHVVMLIDGSWWDSWDSASEKVLYCFVKEDSDV